MLVASDLRTVVHRRWDFSAVSHMKSWKRRKDPQKRHPTDVVSLGAAIQCGIFYHPAAVLKTKSLLNLFSGILSVSASYTRYCHWYCVQDISCIFIIITCFTMTHINVIFPYLSWCSKSLLSKKFSHKNYAWFLVSPIRALCQADCQRHVSLPEQF